LIVEVHPDPERALCDGSQTITPRELAMIHRRGIALVEALAANPTPFDAPLDESVALIA
jgi:3-deoxy-D-arabino-heptulosonate 7-phosphate (DAHP) synthase